MEARIPMSTVMNHVTMNVTVTGVRANRVRQWIAVRIIKLAALVMGVGINVDLEGRS